MIVYYSFTTRAEYQVSLCLIFKKYIPAGKSCKFKLVEALGCDFINLPMLSITLTDSGVNPSN